MRGRTLERLAGHDEPVDHPAQPSPGDTVVGCCHKPMPEAGSHYYWSDAGLALSATRPGASELGVAHWILVCDACFVRFGHRFHAAIAAQQVPLAHTMIWPEGLDVRYVRS